MHRCRVASGTISMSITRSGGTPGADGGSDDNTDRKLSCENSARFTRWQKTIQKITTKIIRPEVVVLQ